MKFCWTVRRVSFFLCANWLLLRKGFKLRSKRKCFGSRCQQQRTGRLHLCCFWLHTRVHLEVSFSLHALPTVFFLLAVRFLDHQKFSCSLCVQIKIVDSHKLPSWRTAEGNKCLSTGALRSPCTWLWRVELHFVSFRLFRFLLLSNHHVWQASLPNSPSN